MTTTKIVHAFPALEITSSELILMKLIGAALTIISVVAGYGIGALATLGSGVFPPTWIIMVTAVAIMVGFFFFRIRSTIRQEAHLRAVRAYVCQAVSGTLAVNEDELLRAINGETVELGSGERIIVERDGSNMNLLVLQQSI